VHHHEHKKTRSGADQIREKGLRVTTQRLCVYTTLSKASSPLSAEEVSQRADPALDLATAYRTLESFVAAGIARAVRLGGRCEKFELANCHHHYLICRSCDRTETVHACLTPATLKAVAAEQPDFASIDDHTLELYGTCRSCATKPSCV
jgi:Fur family zinc uptake transcriptional regulator